MSDQRGIRVTRTKLGRGCCVTAALLLAMAAALLSGPCTLFPGDKAGAARRLTGKIEGLHTAAFCSSALLGRAAARLTPSAGGGPADSSGAGEEDKSHWLKRVGQVAASIVGRVILYTVLLIGLVLIPLGLAGTFVMVGAALVFGLATGFDQITLRFLIVLLGLALLGEGIESLLGVFMARRYGASKWGMWGAFLGGITGAILGTPVPVVGNLVGALIGVFAGAFALEWLGHGKSDSSLRAGWGALVGRTLASAIKLGLGMVIMILVIARTLT